MPSTPSQILLVSESASGKGLFMWYTLQVAILVSQRANLASKAGNQTGVDL